MLPLNTEIWLKICAHCDSTTIFQLSQISRHMHSFISVHQNRIPSRRIVEVYVTMSPDTDESLNAICLGVVFPNDDCKKLWSKKAFNKFGYLVTSGLHDGIVLSFEISVDDLPLITNEMTKFHLEKLILVYSPNRLSPTVIRYLTDHCGSFHWLHGRVQIVFWQCDLITFPYDCWLQFLSSLEALRNEVAVAFVRTTLRHEYALPAFAKSGLLAKMARYIEHADTTHITTESSTFIPFSSILLQILNSTTTEVIRVQRANYTCSAEDVFQAISAWQFGKVNDILSRGPDEYNVDVFLGGDPEEMHELTDRLHAVDGLFVIPQQNSRLLLIGVNHNSGLRLLVIEAPGEANEKSFSVNDVNRQLYLDEYICQKMEPDYALSAASSDLQQCIRLRQLLRIKLTQLALMTPGECRDSAMTQYRRYFRICVLNQLLQLIPPK